MINTTSLSDLTLSEANSLIRLATRVALFVDVPSFDLVMNLTAMTSAPLRSRAFQTSPDVPPAMGDVKVTGKLVRRCLPSFSDTTYIVLLCRLWSVSEAGVEIQELSLFRSWD